MGVEIRLLGGFSVRRDDEEVPHTAFGGRLPRRLVRLLLTRRGELLPTDVVAEALWPQRAPADPPANVKVLVNRARRALGDPTLITTGTGGYTFTRDDRCLVDAEVFRATVATARGHLADGRWGAALKELRTALELWHGDPLPEDTYEEWAREWRQELTSAHVGALEDAATAALHLNDPAAAATFAGQAVTLEPLRERANLLLVRANSSAGDHAAAVETFHTYRRRLADELGLDPSPDALALEQRVLRAEPLGSPVRPVASLQPTSGLEELPFVGRQREVDLIESALGPAGPGVVAVAGRSGTGKSRLLAEVSLRAPIPVLSVRAFPAARTEPWSLARALITETLGLDVDALRAVPPRAVDALTDVVPALAEQVAATGRRHVVAESRRALVLEGSIRLLEAATAPGAVVVVDDLQWADPSSLELIALAHGRVEGLRLLVAFRPEELEPGNPPARFLDDLQRANEPWLVVELGPLGPDAIASLVTDDELAEVLLAHTDRTPLAIAEVLRRLVLHDAAYRDASGRWRPRAGRAVALARDAAQEGQQRMILARARRLSPDRRQLLSVLALAGRAASAGALARTLGVEQRTVLDHLEALARVDLVRLGEDGWVTAHDAIAETISGDLSREERGRLHAMLAAGLQVDGADRAEIAAHLSGAGDAAGAATALADAAHERLERFANQEAEALAERGLGLTSRPATTAVLLEARAEARARRGELAGARADLRAALAKHRDHRDRARLLSRMAALALGAEDVERGAEQAELALVEAGSDPAARGAALLVAAVADMNLARTDRAERRYAEALETFERLGDARNVAHVVSARAMATFLAGDVPTSAKQFVRAAELLEDAGDLIGAITPRSTASHALVFMRQPEAALAEADAAIELARTLGNPEALAMALAHRSEALTALGEVDAALATAAEAVDGATRIGHRAWTALALRTLGIARHAAGDIPGAEEAFRRATAASTVPQLVAWGRARLATVLVERGQLTEAAHHIDLALSEGPPMARYEARVAQAELAAARHDPAARAVAREALALARSGGHLASAERLAVLAG